MKKNTTTIKVKIFDVNHCLAVGIIMAAMGYTILKQQERIAYLEKEREAKGE